MSDGFITSFQVQMVEQQLLKSFKLLSESQVYRFNDQRWPDMWYIVSASGYDFFCNAVPRNSGQIKLLLDSACWSNIFLFIYLFYICHIE